MKKAIKIILPLVFAATAVTTLWISGVNPYNLLMCFWWPMLTVLQFSILLFYFSSLPYKYLLTALGLGASVVPLITLPIQILLNRLIEGTWFQQMMSQREVLGTIYLQTPFIAPVSEEITKLLPVIFILLLLNRYKKYRLLSPLDFALLGLASGAGFNILENIGRFMHGYIWVLGLYRTELYEPLPSLLGIFLFPAMIKSEYLGNPMIWFGHEGVTGAIALAIGFFIYLKRKRYIIIPILTFIIGVFDHAMWNWYQPYPDQLWAKILPGLTLHGRLLPILFVFGLLVAIFILLQNKKRFKAELKQISLPRNPSGGLFQRLNAAIYNIQRQNQIVNAFRHYLKKGIKGEPFDVAVAELAGLMKPVSVQTESKQTDLDGSA